MVCVSLHFPISAHVLGARATRSTHPRALAGFTELFSRILGAPFVVVENPHFWKTKADIVEAIVGHGCGSALSVENTVPRLSRSSARPAFDRAGRARAPGSDPAQGHR